MAMRLAMTAVCAAILVAFCAARWAHGQTSAGSTEQLPPFKLSVDEVSLRFHASGADGLAVNDLKLDELSLLDNGSPPRRIVAFSPCRISPSEPESFSIQARRWRHISASTVLSLSNSRNACCGKGTIRHL